MSLRQNESLIVRDAKVAAVMNDMHKPELKRAAAAVKANTADVAQAELWMQLQAARAQRDLPQQCPSDWEVATHGIFLQVYRRPHLPCCCSSTFCSAPP